MKRQEELKDHYLGCLLGGAVGDALGAPVEFMTMPEIREAFGPDGVVDYTPAYGRVGAVTDDTQMTMFTAEGLLRGACRAGTRGFSHTPSVVYHAYVRWLHTQGERSAKKKFEHDDDGWLIGVGALHSRRAPGATCLAALRGSEMGTIGEPLNQSKGCGGVMRVAPVGLLAPHGPFEDGCEVAAITHGHPSGYLAAGCLALIVNLVVRWQTLGDAVAEMLDVLRTKPHHGEVMAAINQALALARETSLKPSPEVLERMGGGWVAEEALAISLYCALVAGNDFARGVSLAVNHGGDSDSTGAITGNILGALLGARAIPPRWLDRLELRAEITKLAEDLFTGFNETRVWCEKYPGW